MRTAGARKGRQPRYASQRQCAVGRSTVSVRRQWNAEGGGGGTDGFQIVDTQMKHHRAEGRRGLKGAEAAGVRHDENPGRMETGNGAPIRCVPRRETEEGERAGRPALGCRVMW